MRYLKEIIVDALRKNSLACNVAYNLGQHREDSEQIMRTVREADDARRLALQSLDASMAVNDEIIVRAIAKLESTGDIKQAINILRTAL